MPVKFKKHRAITPKGWSEWVNPNPKKYMLACCDCGLVHEMQIGLAMFTEKGIAKIDFLDASHEKGVVFRMRRHKGLTKAIRKQDGIEGL